MEKQIIRKRMLEERVNIKQEDAKAFSSLIADKLLSLNSVRNASCIMAYYPFKNEPDLLPFIQRICDSGKSVALPCVTGECEMRPVMFGNDTRLKTNRYGIPEPVISESCDIVNPDVIIVPGTAFDIRLNRIGFGGGYYDRYLQNTNAVKIGVCFDFQVVDNIDTDEHDIPMDIVITEKRIIGGEK